MRKLLLLVIGAVMLSTGAISEEAETTSITVLKDNVNLRARPSLASETVGQVSTNDALQARRFTDEWVEIVPPSSVDLWVLGDYIKEGVIEGDNVNIRAGAGINFNVVGQLSKGSEVVVRGELGPWKSIAPPDVCSLWIHASLVEVPKKEAEPEPEPAPAEVVEEIAIEIEPEKPAPEPEPEVVKGPAPHTLDLLPAPDQGRIMQYEGILRPRRFIVRSPGKFRLVAYDESGRATTICYVKGNEAQLQALLNRRMTILGHEYWVRRSEYPVVVPKRIRLQ